MLFLQYYCVCCSRSQTQSLHPLAFLSLRWACPAAECDAPRQTVAYMLLVCSDGRLCAVAQRQGSVYIKMNCVDTESKPAVIALLICYL